MKEKNIIRLQYLAGILAFIGASFFFYSVCPRGAKKPIFEAFLVMTDFSFSIFIATTAAFVTKRFLSSYPDTTRRKENKTLILLLTLFLCTASTTVISIFAIKKGVSPDVIWMLLMIAIPFGGMWLFNRFRDWYDFDE